MNSPHAAAFASFSTTTGSPVGSWTMSRISLSCHPRLGAKRTVERSASTYPAAPTPTARTSSQPADLLDRLGDRSGDPVRVVRGGDAHPGDDLPAGVDRPGGDLRAAEIDADGQTCRSARSCGTARAAEPTVRVPTYESA